MTRPLALLGQAIAYLLFAALLGVFSSWPAYTHLDPDKALIKLSFSHAADRAGACRRLTSEEIAALPANMRRTMDCPRGRLPLLVELDLDGERMLRRVLPPTGLHSDGSSAIYARFPVPAGRHTLAVRLRDSDRAEGFDHQAQTAVDLAPGESLVVDFRPEAGGFVFR